LNSETYHLVIADKCQADGSSIRLWKEISTPIKYVFVKYPPQTFDVLCKLGELITSTFDIFLRFYVQWFQLAEITAVMKFGKYNLRF
uniref:MULE domain-containing protein n=1 Tax=Ascaris lumbricoides TaxID=6252 RepID=A0A0M3IPI8_ASCLU